MKQGSVTSDYQLLHEFFAAAHGRLDINIWDYLIGGTETETTVRRNRLALDRLALKPRVLRDVSAVDLSGEFLGRKLRLPIAVAPIGSLESFDAEAGAGAARAAARAGVVSFHSIVSQPALEAVAAAAPDGCRVFQLYVRGDDGWVDDHVRRAIDHGYAGFCLTVDTALYSRRERDIAKRFDKPWRRRATGGEFQAALTWSHVARFKQLHDIPLILKGIMTVEDAEIACDHGVDVIYVSNHGGRQIDHALGTMDVLPDIVQAVAGRASIIVDGGFMRGTDVVKALATGADQIGLGRLPAAALAAAGSAGLERALELLFDEVRIAMGLSGSVRLDELGPDLVCAAPEVGKAGVLSAFPLLDLNED